METRKWQRKVENFFWKMPRHKSRTGYRTRKNAETAVDKKEKGEMEEFRKKETSEKLLVSGKPLLSGTSATAHKLISAEKLEMSKKNQKAQEQETFGWNSNQQSAAISDKRESDKQKNSDKNSELHAIIFGKGRELEKWEAPSQNQETNRLDNLEKDQKSKRRKTSIWDFSTSNSNYNNPQTTEKNQETEQRKTSVWNINTGNPNYNNSQTTERNHESGQRKTSVWNINTGNPNYNNSQTTEKNHESGQRKTSAWNINTGNPNYNNSQTTEKNQESGQRKPSVWNINTGNPNYNNPQTIERNQESGQRKASAWNINTGNPNYNNPQTTERNQESEQKKSTPWNINTGNPNYNNSQTTERNEPEQKKNTSWNNTTSFNNSSMQITENEQEQTKVQQENNFEDSDRKEEQLHNNESSVLPVFDNDSAVGEPQNFPTRKNSRRKRAGTRALTVAVTAVLLIIIVHFTGGLPEAFAQGLENVAINLGERIGKQIFLQDKALFSYVRYNEQDRGTFRFMSEQLFCSEMLLDSASKKNSDSTEELEGNSCSGTIIGEDNQEKQTNEAILEIEKELMESIMAENQKYGEYLPVSYVEGNVVQLTPTLGEDHTIGSGTAGKVPLGKLLLENNYSLEKLSDTNFLLKNYYIVDSITSTTPEMFNASELLSKDLSIEEGSEGYQILIYHTHASESFVDSRPGEVMDTVRGPGEYLAELLRERGYTVYHDMTAYDRKDGKDNRNQAYTTARLQIEPFLKEHPEIQVVIDLHRDGGAKRMAVIDGKETAKIMLFNGLCRNSSGPIADLENPNLSGNLAFSLQLNLVGRVLYPDLMHRIYLKNYRYNQHYRERSILVELGTDQNTVEEAYNAMEFFVDVLDSVLQK